MNEEENKNYDAVNDGVNEGVNEGVSEGLNLTQPILPEVEFTTDETVSDGIDVVADDSLENYSQKEEEEEVEDREIELTFDEIKKLMRYQYHAKGEKPPKIGFEEVANLTDEEYEELKEIRKIRDRKALLKFVNKTKEVSDEEAKNLTDEEFLDLTNKALVMSKFINYSTKKDFGKKYKKKRQNKNKMARRSRAQNRR